VGFGIFALLFAILVIPGAVFAVITASCSGPGS
jgi:hypothetical protein